MKTLMTLLLAIPILAHAAQDTPPAPTPSTKADAEHTAPAWNKKQIGPSAGAFDQEYAWDEFNHRGRMVWACRGVQTGDFVDPAYCASKEKVDAQWPSKATPPNWKE